jgi:hypothetical protein
VLFDGIVPSCDAFMLSLRNILPLLISIHIFISFFTLFPPLYMKISDFFMGHDFFLFLLKVIFDIRLVVLFVLVGLYLFDSRLD